MKLSEKTQFPRVRNVPEYATSAGRAAIELAASAGLILDPWQRLALDDMLGEDANGSWSAFEFALLVARQNGKGAILEARELAGLYLFSDKLIIHSAHEFKTAQEAFLRIKSLIDNTDALRRRVKTIRTSHGEEGIELRDGTRLRFMARTRSSGRGFSGDLVILDEAQELPRSSVAAILPTLSARPNPQVVYTGTVPSPINDAEHFTSLRDRGRAGGSPSLGWLEWSPGEDWDDLDDRNAWAVSNPGRGYRISETFIERERAALSDADFARERLSIWPKSATGSVIDAKAWRTQRDPQSTASNPVVFAIDVPMDRRCASIGSAGLRAIGGVHIELVERRVGTRWVVPHIKELNIKWSPSAIVIDAGGPAASFIKELTDAGLPIVVVNTREIAQACGSFYDAVGAGTLWHIGQPELDEAIASATKRPLGDAWAWSRKNATTDISPLVAVTLAKFGLANTPDYDPLNSIW